MMIAERDYRFWRAGAPVERLAMIAKRDYRSTWRPGAAERNGKTAITRMSFLPSVFGQSLGSH